MVVGTGHNTNTLGLTGYNVLAMATRRLNNRERILHTAGELLYRRGYNGTSVDDIVEASGVSKSNFYYHFPSKEDLGIAVLSVRREELERMLRETLGDPSRSPASRLAAFVAAVLDHQESELDRCGCPFGNLVAEMTEHSERIRCFLSGLFADITRELAEVIRIGQVSGELRRDADADELATLILQTLQGMQLIIKCDKDPRPARMTGALLVDLMKSPRHL